MIKKEEYQHNIISSRKELKSWLKYEKKKYTSLKEFYENNVIY